MKTLLEYLNEASVMDIEGNLKTTSNNIYPVPKLKDFYKATAGWEIYWYCPDIIQDYVKYIKCTKPQSLQNVSKIVDLSKIDSIRCYIRNYGAQFTTLSIAEWDNPDNCMPLECSRGRFENVTAVKKSVLKLFKTIKDHPECLKRLFEMHNDVCAKEYSINRNGWETWSSNSEYKNQSIDDLINKLS